METGLYSALVTSDCNFVVVVNVADAGEGNMEISISPSNGRNLPNEVLQVGPGMFEVSFTPIESGSHCVNVFFNSEHVPGMQQPQATWVYLDLHSWATKKPERPD